MLNTTSRICHILDEIVIFRNCDFREYNHTRTCSKRVTVTKSQVFKSHPTTIMQNTPYARVGGTAGSSRGTTLVVQPLEDCNTNCETQDTRYELVLVTEQLLPKRVSGLQLTGTPAELRCIYVLALRRTNI